MSHPVKSNVKTLKKVWALLKDLGLEGMLFGGEKRLDPASIVNEIFATDKINQLLQTITGEECFDFEELPLDEVVDIVANFFTDIAKPFSELQKRGILVETKKVQTTE